MTTVLWLLAAFAAYEAVSVATTGKDVFYGYPVSGQQQQTATLEWGGGAALLALLAARG